MEGWWDMSTMLLVGVDRKCGLRKFVEEGVGRFFYEACFLCERA